MPKTIEIQNRQGKTATVVEFTDEALAYVKDADNLKNAMKGQFIVLESADYTLSRPSKNPGNLVFKRLAEMLEDEGLIPDGYRVAQSTQVPKDEAAFRFVKA